MQGEGTPIQDQRGERGLVARRRVPGAQETCEICRKPTTGRKPFCTEHVDRLPYAAWLLEVESETRKVLVRSIGSARHVDTDGEIARDILRALAIGPNPNTERALKKRSGFLDWTGELSGRDQRHAWAHFLEALERAGKIRRYAVGSLRGTPRRLVELVSMPAWIRLPEEIFAGGEHAA